MSDEAAKYILALQRKEFEAIGFIPWPRTEEYLRRRQILMAEENDELCGFLMFGAGWPTLKVYQACIQYDARRAEHGRALVARLIARAQQSGHHAISLWCANDLDANAFWRSCGFTFGGQRRGGARRGRLLNLWIMRVPGALTLFSPDPSEEGAA